ncbi:MAG: KEOPS complex subunit Pcc1 [Halolamina sp.]
MTAGAAHTATLSVSYPTPESAALVEHSLRPEVDRIDDDRAAASVRRDGQTVEVTVRAADLVALRAGTGSWSRLLAVAERTAGLDDAERVDDT